MASVLDSASKKGSKVSAETPCAIKRFYRRKARADLRSLPKTWRTRKDLFADVWNDVRLLLELNPERSPKVILSELIEKHPDSFKPSHLRTDPQTNGGLVVSVSEEVGTQLLDIDGIVKIGEVISRILSSDKEISIY